jgi:hypothetical protein
LDIQVSDDILEGDSSAQLGCDIYLLPFLTLVRSQIRKFDQLGIKSNQDLFGGVVDFPHQATKLISHQLFTPSSAQPDGWSFEFSNAVEDVVLPGYTVFSLEDGKRAGMALLEQGFEVRGKDPNECDGFGQIIINNRVKLEVALSSANLQEGYVLEKNLKKVLRTLSIGPIILGPHEIAYHGYQEQTQNHTGQKRYGSSHLEVVRGDFDTLLKHVKDPQITLAIQQASRYDSATGHFPGAILSRRNYDVIQGYDGSDNFHSGVLESSWRLGGATCAELLAIKLLIDHPDSLLVSASARRDYTNEPLTDGDRIFFDGKDPEDPSGEGTLRFIARADIIKNTSELAA